jgi:hypothetical protein
MSSSGDDIHRRDIHRRIRNILDVCPASSWSLEESRAVLGVLSCIVRVRQTDGEARSAAQLA